MPWKLVPPRKGKTTCWYVRGKYCGIRLDRSTGASEAAAARRIFKTWREQAERGEFKQPDKGPTETRVPSFVNAATAYMNAGGNGQYLPPILEAWPTKLLADIDQIAIDTVAAQLYPLGTPQTRNRQVYTPISAVLKRAGIKTEILRPKGWQSKKGTSWLEPEQAFSLFAAADAVDPEFGLLCRFLLYTGLRLGEGLSRRLRDLQLDRSYLYLPDSKSGEPRGCHIPPYLGHVLQSQPPRPVTAVVRDEHGHFLTGRPLEDAGVPFLGRNQEARIFRFHDGGALRDMLKKAMRDVGLSFPRRQGGFHIFCHCYGSWMHRWGELDTHGLTRTGRWADADSADRYVHTQASEEARRSDRLPTPERGQVVEIKSRAG